jgi:hypothetical protein
MYSDKSSKNDDTQAMDMDKYAYLSVVKNFFSLHALGKPMFFI